MEVGLKIVGVCWNVGGGLLKNIDHKPVTMGGGRHRIFP